jgi:hypothetical protein
MSTMTTTGTPARNHLDDDPMHGSIAVHLSHVRLSIAQKATAKTVPIPSILHKIMNKIRDTDQTATFHDILGQPVSLEKFPVDKDAFDTAFGTIVPEGKNSQVIVGLTIHSKMTFGPIKTAIMPTLRHLNTFIRPHHSTSWKNLDAIPIAHLHEVHPSFADTSKVKADLIELLQMCVAKVSDETEYKLHLGENTPELPEIMLYTGRAVGRLDTQDMTSEVVEIYVARPYVALMKYLFQISSTLNGRKLQIVPRDFKFNHPAIYGKILNKQNDYLENHRNIGIVAIPCEAMEHCITDLNGKTWKTLKDAILAVEGVSHVHACKRTLDLGKWNISTNVSAWEHVKTWLDANLNKLYRRIPVSTRNKYPAYDDFANPMRLHSRRNAAPSTSTEATDAYAQSIQNHILGHNTLKIPTRARAPAWKATPRLVYTLDDMHSFPSLEKPHADERSLGSTATTTSLTAATDDAIRKLETQWKTDKDTFSTNLETTLNTRLASMDTKIASVLSSLSTTVATAIQTQMESLETKIAKMVSDAILKQSGTLVTQVGASITGEHSPFVTTGKLKTVLDDFIGQINLRIDTLTDGAHRIDANGSPVRKHLKTNPDHEATDTSMDTRPSQVSNPYAATTEAVAGQKN